MTITSGSAVARAIAAFLDRPDFTAQTRRSYAGTLRAVLERLDPASREVPSGAVLRAATVACFVHTAPNTWNRHAAAMESFVRYAARENLLPELDVDLPRRRAPGDHTRALRKQALARLWARTDIPLREKTLWRLLYESAARATEVLSLNIEDLDLPNREATLVGKAGDRDRVHWQSGTARLLPRLIAGRQVGPLFLTNRRPVSARAPAATDLCPLTGKARLSYRRAEELFHLYTGWTLHQLRHSAITHLAEENVALPLLMAKSRHSSLRSLQRYARPGPDAVAALTAAYDPARRR